MSDLNLMHGTTGVYQTEYNGTRITVRVFEAVELIGNGYETQWVAFNTYQNIQTGVVHRVEHDAIERAKAEHCKAYAAQVDPTYGELYKAHFAHAYLRTIL